MSFLVSTAHAQDAAPGALGASEAFVQFLPIILIFVVFYFLLIRPQQRKMKQHKEMLSAIRRGDRVVTGGGIIGTVNKVLDEDRLQVEIAEGVRVQVQRSMVTGVLAKTEAAGDAGKDDETGGTDNTPGDQQPRGSRLTRIPGGKRD